MAAATARAVAAAFSPKRHPVTDPRNDHFALFDLPPRFAIDEALLEQAYRRVQAQVHPDRFAAAGAAERRVAMQWATLANEAFRTLRSPLARAAYLCERTGSRSAPSQTPRCRPNS